MPADVLKRIGALAQAVGDRGDIGLSSMQTPKTLASGYALRSNWLAASPPMLPLQPMMIGFAVCGLVFAADMALGAQISPWALYLVPIVALGWLFGRPAAMVVATVSSLLVCAAGLLGGHPYHTVVDFLISWGNRTMSLLAVAWLIGKARKVAVLESIVTEIRHDL